MSLSNAFNARKESKGKIQYFKNDLGNILGLKHPLVMAEFIRCFLVDITQIRSLSLVSKVSATALNRKSKSLLHIDSATTEDALSTGLSAMQP